MSLISFGELVELLGEGGSLASQKKGFWKGGGEQEFTRRIKGKCPSRKRKQLVQRPQGRKSMSEGQSESCCDLRSQGRAERGGVWGWGGKGLP